MALMSLLILTSAPDMSLFQLIDFSLSMGHIFLLFCMAGILDWMSDITLLVVEYFHIPVNDFIVLKCDVTLELFDPFWSCFFRFVK